MTSLPPLRAAMLIWSSSSAVRARRAFGRRRGLATLCAGLAPGAISPSAMARLKIARTAAITCSPACRPPRVDRRDRAAATVSRCIASMSVAAIRSSGRSPHACAIRNQ